MVFIGEIYRPKRPNTYASDFVVSQTRNIFLIVIKGEINRQISQNISEVIFTSEEVITLYTGIKSLW